EEIEQGEKMAIGDIFICFEVAKKQASKKKYDLDDEMAVLFVHGLLHLIGFDHENDKQEVEMEKLTQEILYFLNAE
ncbi:rRNA maturation RNase YbeY, partial [Patescibacteria group bacterium]